MCDGEGRTDGRFKRYAIHWEFGLFRFVRICGIERYNGNNNDRCIRYNNALYYSAPPSMHGDGLIAATIN